MRYKIEYDFWGEKTQSSQSFDNMEDANIFLKSTYHIHKGEHYDIFFECFLPKISDYHLNPDDNKKYNFAYIIELKI